MQGSNQGSAALSRAIPSAPLQLNIVFATPGADFVRHLHWRESSCY
jgi:hypothetical protein